MYSEDLLYKRLKRQKAFYKHLSSYVAVMLGLFFLNIMSSSVMWIQYPAIGWGMALLMHYFKAFGIPFLGLKDEAWVRSEYEKECGFRPTGNISDQYGIDALDLDQIPSLRKEWRDSDLV